MNRRDFLRNMILGGTAAVLAPKVALGQACPPKTGHGTITILYDPNPMPVHVPWSVTGLRTKSNYAKALGRRMTTPFSIRDVLVEGDRTKAPRNKYPAFYDFGTCIAADPNDTFKDVCEVIGLRDVEVLVTAFGQGKGQGEGMSIDMAQRAHNILEVRPNGQFIVLKDREGTLAGRFPSSPNYLW